jgi:hypothetical protein
MAKSTNIESGTSINHLVDQARKAEKTHPAKAIE